MPEVAHLTAAHLNKATKNQFELQGRHRPMHFGLCHPRGTWSWASITRERGRVDSVPTDYLLCTHDYHLPKWVTSTSKAMFLLLTWVLKGGHVSLLLPVQKFGAGGAGDSPVTGVWWDPVSPWRYLPFSLLSPRLHLLWLVVYHSKVVCSNALNPGFSGNPAVKLFMQRAR